jgi:molybdopterin molybdotransferase
MPTDADARSRILAAVSRLSPKHVPILEARGLVLADAPGAGPLDAKSLGALAANGQHTVFAHRRPRVAIVSIGDNLAPPGDPLQPGQTYDGNRILAHLLALDAGAVVDASLHVPERADMLRWALDGLSRFDLIVTLGGSEALLREVVAGSAADFADGPRTIPVGLAFHGGVMCLSLPYDADAILATFEALVAPALKKMMGAAVL